MIIAITGRPGIGKSTIFNKVISDLRNRGYTFYGFYCPEVRERGIRIGFKIIDIYSGDSGWLALTLDKAIEMGYKNNSKKIGRYVVIEDEASKIGINALRRVMEGKIILGIDEIGPMELSIKDLRAEIIHSLRNTKKALLVIHRNLNDAEILSIFRTHKMKTYIVTEINRATLYVDIVSDLIEE